VGRTAKKRTRPTTEAGECALSYPTLANRLREKGILRPPNAGAGEGRAAASYLLNSPLITNATLAGRSARRRMKYPYQSLPYGT
jgi:succinate dehydrogenase/fumarate reductase flavoprotein subunit